MRLRIQTFAPLPELKAWFVPEIQDAQETIFGLKGLLCSGVQTLRNGRFQAKDLTLVLEGFELLNDSPVTAVRDGDLIFVKVSSLAANEDVQMDAEPGARAAVNSRKRKRITSDVGIPLQSSKNCSGRKTVTQRISTARGETSNSEEETTSDSESTTSSTSVSSSSDSSSSSSSSLSTSSAAHSPPKNIKKLTERQGLSTAKQISSQKWVRLRCNLRFFGLHCSKTQWHTAWAW